MLVCSNSNENNKYISHTIYIVPIDMEEFTTIRVSKELRNTLSQYGKKQESFESILSKIIKEKSQNQPQSKIPTNDLEVI